CRNGSAALRARPPESPPPRARLQSPGLTCRAAAARCASRLAPVAARESEFLCRRSPRRQSQWPLFASSWRTFYPVYGCPMRKFTLLVLLLLVAPRAVVAPHAQASGSLRLYIARHGETDWNVQHKLQGMTDIPLNE